MRICGRSCIDSAIANRSPRKPVNYWIIFFTSFGLSINSTKTDIMVLNTEEPTESIVTLKNVELKAFIDATQPNTGESEMNHRIQLACIKFSEISNLLQNFHINHTRVSFLNCFVRSRLTYSSQN